MSLLTLGSVAIGRDLAALGSPLAKDATVSKTRAVSEETAGQSATGEPTATPSVAGFGQLLVAQIPSEALIAYTTLLALFSASDGSYTTGKWVVYGAAIVVCAVAVLASYLAQRDYIFDDSGDTRGVVTLATTDSKPSGTDKTQAIAATAPVPVLPPSAPAGSDPQPPRPEDEPAGAAGQPATSVIGQLHLPFLPAITAMLAMAVYGLTVPGSPLQSVSGTAFGIWSGCLAVGGGVMMSIIAPFLGRGNAATPATEQK